MPQLSNKMAMPSRRMAKIVIEASVKSDGIAIELAKARETESESDE